APVSTQYRASAWLGTNVTKGAGGAVENGPEAARSTDAEVPTSSWHCFANRRLLLGSRLPRPNSNAMPADKTGRSSVRIRRLAAVRLSTKTRWATASLRVRPCPLLTQSGHEQRPGVGASANYRSEPIEVGGDDQSHLAARQRQHRAVLVGQYDPARPRANRDARAGGAVYTINVERRSDIAD